MSAAWWRDLEGGHEVVADAELAALIAKNVLDELERERQAAAAERGLPPIVSVREALAEWITEEQRGDQGAIQTGWPRIDKGLEKRVRPGEVLVLAARTGVGKTWAIQHIIETTLAADPTAAACLASQEMPAFQIAERLAMHALGVTGRRARERAAIGLEPQEVIDARPDLTRLAICEKIIPVSALPGVLEAANLMLEKPCNLLAVDYLQLLGWDGHPNARTYERASENSRALKQVAKEHRVVILAACQLSRDGGADGTRRPSLDALRDSGVIEEAADRIITFWREGDDEDTGRVDGLRINAEILKNRFGPIGHETPLAYDSSLRLAQAADADAVPDFGWADET